MTVQHDTTIILLSLSQSLSAEFTTRQNLEKSDRVYLWYIMFSRVYVLYKKNFEFILTQLVMFGCLECSCPEYSKINFKSMSGHFLWVVTETDILVPCDQKVNAQFAQRYKLE